MSPERLQRLQALFKAALEQPPERRSVFLETACSDDPLLRDELASLLNADDQAEASAFLEEPALELSMEITQEESFIGQTIGPYSLLRLIGRGGMGEVYLALREKPFKQYVALKLIPHGAHSRELRQRFEMERQILASLGHPNIASLLDGGTTVDGASYLVMEYVEGVSITQYCDKRQLSIAARLALFEQVCKAVHYAHQNLIVHRDLKPSNILVTKEGQVKLLDFGVAKLLNPALSSVDVPVTQTLFRMMTPAYAAPEQIRGKPVTTATDVYALGVLLYELLTGHRPYRLTSSSPVEMEQVICEQEPERPSTKVGRDETIEYRDGSRETLTAVSVSAARGVTADRLRRRLRGDLDNIVLMALRKEAHRRYGSAEQFAMDIGRYLAGLPVEARSSTLAYRAQKFVTRHRAGVVAAMLVLVSLVGGLSMSLWRERQVGQARDQAEVLLVRAETVTNFMIGLFEASDPSESLGDTLTSYELLARGAQRAEALEGEPEVRAQVLDVVGGVYERLGQYEKAQPLLEQALALRRSVLGEEHEDVAASLDNLAYLLDSQGDYDAAEPLYREALRLRRKLLGNAPEVAESLNNLAGLLRRTGNYGEAEPLAREALAIYHDLFGEEHVLIAESLNNLALLSQDQGDYEAAEALFREALAMNRKLLGEANPDVAVNLNNLARILSRRGDFEAAESFAREALAMRRKIYGEAHPRVAASLQNLASLLHDKGDLATAEAFYREALAMRRALLGAEHPRTAETLNGLALLRSQQGAHEEAESLMRASLALRRKQMGEESTSVAFGLNNLAVVLRRKGAYEEAEMLIRESLALRRTLLGERHPSVARALQGLASLLVVRGGYEAAEPRYLEALSIYREHFGEESRRVQEAYLGLAELYAGWGKPEQEASYRALLQTE